MFAGYQNKQRESSAYLISCDVTKTEIHIWWSVGSAKPKFFFTELRPSNYKVSMVDNTTIKGLSWALQSMLIDAIFTVLIRIPIPTLESILPISESDQPTGTHQRWIFCKHATATKQQDLLQRLVPLFKSVTVESRHCWTTLNINRRSNAI